MSALDRTLDGLNARAARKGGERILVVDDDADFREAIHEQLEALGFEVEMAADAPGALSILKRDDDFDLLISDVVMPWPMGGREFAATVKKRWGDMPILFISGYTENTISTYGLLDSDDHYLAKPFRVTHLANAIRIALKVPAVA